MMFNALLVSKDEEVAAVLTPLLARCGVGVAGCGYPEALCRLAEEKFDSVIVDFDDPHSATLVLQNASQATAGVKPERFGIGPVIVYGLLLTAFGWQAFGLVSGPVWFATLALGCTMQHNRSWTARPSP